MKNKLLILCVVIALILAALYFIFGSAIFREGNPIPIFRGIINLLLSNDNVVPIDSARYITKTDGGADSIISFIESKGFKYRGQYNGGYVFQKQNNSITSTISISDTQYSKYFTIWKTIPGSLSE